jgi:hypothetical protein
VIRHGRGLASYPALVAARRLVILMIVLLAASTLAAALVPPPDRDEEGPTSSEQTRPGPKPQPIPPGPSGRPIAARLRIANAKPRTIRASVGDQIALTVTSRFADQVELAAFGLLETAAPYAPAHFDFIADRAGTFPVRTVESQRLVGRIEVAKRGKRVGRKRCPRDGIRSRARREPGSTRVCARRDSRGR